MILPSMKADVDDCDEMGTGRRREGSLSASYNWFLKLGGTAALGASGLLLQANGYNAKLPAQPQSVLEAMHCAYVFMPIVFWAGAIALVGFYRLDRNAMSEIRVVLGQRRMSIGKAKIDSAY